MSLKLSDKLAGLFAAACLAINPYFLTQATFMLPEIMVGFLSLLTLYFYIQKKIFWEVFFGTLLVLTKESGLVLVGSILLVDFIRIIAQFRSKSWIGHLADFSFHLIPLVFVTSFFIIQKIKLGWFFFPEHMNMIELDWHKFWNKFSSIYHRTFENDGRAIFTYISVAVTIWLIIKKKLSSKETLFVGLSYTFFIFYLAFSALNFFTTRYVLAFFPIYYLLFGFLLYKTFLNIPWISLPVILIYGWIAIEASSKTTSIGDTSLKFINVVNVHKEAIRYCEEADYYDRIISTHFLMFFNFNNPYMGYRETDIRFKNIWHYNSEVKDLVIISSVERGKRAEELEADETLALIKSFENDYAWCKIYQKKKKNESPKE